MKALPPALRNGLLRMRRDGASFATISKAFGVPVGTVKSVCSKAGVKAVMEPHGKKGKGRGMEPRKNDECRMTNDECRTGSVMEHRGLRVEDMPGRTGWERRSTFALFKRGEWPPLHWHIPAKLEGAELREMLMERAVMYRPKKKEGA
jgi:hypothetical protein